MQSGKSEELQKKSLFDLVNNNDLKTLREILATTPSELVNLNETNEKGETPLIRAIKHFKDHALVQILLEGKANPNTTKNDNTPLHIAVQNKDYNSVLQLINHKADVNSTNDSKKTPLHLTHEKDIVSLLLNAKANVNAIDENKITPLHENMYCYSVSEKLIAAKANINAQSNEGTTPLMIAVESEQGSTVQLLLEAKANAYIKNKKDETAY